MPGLGDAETVSLGQNRLCCMILPEMRDTNSRTGIKRQG